MIHTPGPWTINDRHSHRQILNRSERHVADVRAYWPACTDEPTPDMAKNDADEGLANARLIAAAPDLYAALAAIVTAMATEPSDDMTWEERKERYDEEFHAACVALDKAQGVKTETETPSSAPPVVDQSAG